MKKVIFDTETVGLNPQKDKIVEIIKDYYFENINNIDKFIMNQNSSLDACITNVENELQMNINMFTFS